MIPLSEADSRASDGSSEDSKSYKITCEKKNENVNLNCI